LKHLSRKRPELQKYPELADISCHPKTPVPNSPMKKKRGKICLKKEAFRVVNTPKSAPLPLRNNARFFENGIKIGHTIKPA
jgi:hypothetical protein